MNEEKRAGVSLQEAVENLTVGEVEAIERHYGKDFPDKLSGTNVAASVAWAFERRRLLGHPDRPDWDAMSAWTIKDLNTYFEAESIEVDPEDPETPEGKGDTEPT